MPGQIPPTSPFVSDRATAATLGVSKTRPLFKLKIKGESNNDKGVQVAATTGVSTKRGVNGKGGIESPKRQGRSGQLLDSFFAYKIIFPLATNQSGLVRADRAVSVPPKKEEWKYWLPKGTSFDPTALLKKQSKALLRAAELWVRHLTQGKEYARWVNFKTQKFWYLGNTGRLFCYKPRCKKILFGVKPKNILKCCRTQLILDFAYICIVEILDLTGYLHFLKKIKASGKISLALWQTVLTLAILLHFLFPSFFPYSFYLGRTPRKWFWPDSGRARAGGTRAHCQYSYFTLQGGTSYGLYYSVIKRSEFSWNYLKKSKGLVPSLGG